LNGTDNATAHTPNKDIKQVGSLTLGERGPGITFLACINAVDNSIPPSFISLLSMVILKNMPKGGREHLGRAHTNGRCNSSIPTEYLKHFT
jgi:hypothetical protein